MRSRKKMFGLLLIIICCALLCVWSWVRSRGPSPPLYPGAVPLIGHAYLSIGLEAKDFWELEKDIYNFCSKNGGVAQLRIRLKPVYVITDLEDCLTIANTCLDKEIIMYNYVKEMYNRGLLTAGPSTWKPHRKLLSPVFNQQVLNTFTIEHNAQAGNLVSQLAQEAGKAPFDIQPYLIENVLKTVYRTTLGMKTEEDTVMKYSHATEGLFGLYLDRFQRVWLHNQFLFNLSSFKRKQEELMYTIKNITSTVINERKSVLKNMDSDFDLSSDKFKPLLDHLLNLADKQNAFTDEEIREHLDTIIAGAYDSTTKALVFTLIFLGSNQDVQTKLYEELQNVLGDEDRDVNRHDLPNMVYLETVVKESLRLLPPAPRIARTSQTPVKLKNYTLPAGSTCVLALSYINRNPMWGADAEQFRPERWLDPATLPENPNAFASFGLGKRNCIGKQYAMMTIKTYLANILRRYRVTGDITKLETRCDIFLTPVNGHHISLELRK